MAKELFISTTPHETKVAVVEDEQLAEIYFERENEYTLAGSIYKGRVTRVLPGMQSAFVDIGLERDAFLYVTDFLEEQEDQEDYEQVAVPARPDEPQHTRPRQESGALQDGEADAEAEGEPVTGPGDEQAATQPFDRAPRRWRGRRGRRRGRGGFQGQDQGSGYDQSGQGSPVSGEQGDSEPVILPGESLSKYRETEISEQKTASAPAEHAAPQEQHVAPGSIPSRESSSPSTGTSPQNLSETISVLPGESISKYRNRDERSNTEPAARTPAPPQPASGSRWERARRWFQRDSTAAEQAPSGPPVVALPGESLAKYRRGEAPIPDASEAVQTQQAASPSVADARETREARLTQPEQSANRLQHVAAEHTDVEERVQHGLGETESVQAAVEHEPRTEDFGAEKMSEPRPEVGGSEPHQFGAGVLEEEEMEGEEAEVAPFGEHLDEDIYEELEEETIDPENAEQLVEAVREAHVIQRLGLRDGEPPDLEDHPEGEEVESFVPEDGQGSSEHLEAAGTESSADESQDSVEEEAEDGEEEEAKEEGRAELRAPANTAAFQQRTERTERAPDRFRRGRRGRPMRGRRNIQRESQPTISDLLKEGQEILVQIAKEPIAKKGARITSHIALPGRFLVYMPTVNHVGVSRKIGSDEERQRLKRILISEKGAAHGGFIVRTAAAGASEEDLRSDLRFLINLWNDIKSRAEGGKAPALIYHDLNLVERILRDQVTSNFTSIWVDSEQEYERIVRFLGRFQPAMVRRAKLYTKETPLFEQFGIQEEINNALKSKVWLKSGGYIVINQTEALVAIDINTGKYVGKTQRLEDTIVKTNTDAIREIVRQIRLRDLGGIIVIDFIDMDERKNRQKVMQALEEALKSDRAPSKVLQFNDFGLVAITRKRVKQSLERTLSTSCTYCTGTGMIKSVQTVCNEIYVEMRKMSKHFEQRDVMLRVNPEVVKALKASNGRWLQEMEELTGKTIIVKSDPLLHQEQFDIN